LLTSYISIRPLLTAEIRSRTLCGRYQISDGGQHLVDGIPFGRPMLRTPNRPAVRIPPPTRQRLLEGASGGHDEYEIARLITTNGETPPRAEWGDVSNPSDPDTLRPNGKSVRFGDLPDAQLDDADSEGEDDGDFAPDEGSEDTDVSTEDSSEEESEESSVVSDISSSDASSETSSSSKSDNHGESDGANNEESHRGEGTGPNLINITSVVLGRSPPGEGKKVTKTRNKRRRDARRFQAMKDSGKLPPSATIDDWRKTLEPQFKAGEGSIMAPSVTSKKRRRDEDDSTTEEGAENASELEQRTQQTTTQIGNASVSVEKSASPSASAPESGSALKEGPSPAKRLRPNVAAIGRILAHQAKTRELLALKKKPDPVEESREPPPDPEFWKTKLNLSAFECWEEEYDLSAPPFPFKQHWDPASQIMRDKDAAKRKKKQTRAEREAEEAVAERDEDNEAIELDYGDPLGDSQKHDGDATDAIEAQLLQEVAVAAKNDMPPLPEDMTTLSELTPDAIKPGAIIAFKLLAMNAQNMNPEISNYKTAVVETEGDSGNGAGTIAVRIALRDKPQKEKWFDRNGNRVYAPVDNFQVEDSEDEEDDGLEYYQFNELLEPKLVKAV
jgi:hypothetical protein